VPDRDRRKEARAGIAASSRWLQEFPAVRWERSALTSHAYDAIMICKKARPRCRRTRPRSDRKGFRKGRLKYPHTHTFDYVLSRRLPSSSELLSPAMPVVFGFLRASTPAARIERHRGTPRPRKPPNLVAGKRQFVEQFQADLGHPISREEIFRFPSPPNQRLFPRCPVSTRGADRTSSRTRDVMRWTRERRRADGIAGRIASLGRNASQEGETASTVIASGAEQSMPPLAARWIASLRSQRRGGSEGPMRPYRRKLLISETLPSR